MVDDKFRGCVQEKLKQITVKVSINLTQKGSGFRGTGFFITPDGYILTAWHCIEDVFKDLENNAIEIEYEGECFLALLDEGKSIKNKDIAVLKITVNHPVNCIPLLEHIPKKGSQGSEVVAVGYSGVYKNELQVFVGTISLIRNYEIVVTGPVQGSGQSGGALYHYATNRIIGIVTNIFNQEHLRNSGLATPFDFLFKKWPALSKINKKIEKSWTRKCQRKRIPILLITTIGFIILWKNLNPNNTQVSEPPIPQPLETFDVTLVLSSRMQKGAKVFIDDKPATIVKEILTEITIQVNQKKIGGYKITVVNKNSGKKCQKDNILIDKNKTLYPCQ